MRKLTLFFALAMLLITESLHAQFPNMGLNGNTLYFSPTSRQIGIGTDDVTDPGTRLRVATGKLQIAEPGSEQFLELIDPTNSSSIFSQWSDEGNTNFDLSLLPFAPTSSTYINYFRYTNTTGDIGINFYRGDGTDTKDAQIGINGANSYFQSNGGNFGIGIDSPAAKLDVNGNSIIHGNGPILALEGTDHSYVDFYPLGFGSSSNAIVGFNKPDSPHFQIRNKAAGGNIVMIPDGNVGVGMSNPSVKMQVLGNRLRLSTPGNPSRFIEMRTDGNGLDLNSNKGDLYLHSNDGNVNIARFGGHTIVGHLDDPEDKLEVRGQARLNAFDAVLHSRNNLDYNFDLIGTYQGWDSKAVYIAGYNANNNPSVKAGERVYVGGPGSETLVVDLMNEKVGVGVKANEIPAAYKLAVDGRIICEELRVRNSAAWPDYVFENNYNLLSLDEVATHIEEKGHLPGMPSAAEVEAEGGFVVGDMQRRLLEKVEELTLYTIDVNKKNQDLETQLQAALNTIEQLQQRVEHLEK